MYACLATFLNPDWDLSHASALACASPCVGALNVLTTLNRKLFDGSLDLIQVKIVLIFWSSAPP